MGNINEVKVHLLLTNQNFNSLECNLIPNETRNRIYEGDLNFEYKINAPKNKYYSNGILGDELVYVHNRK